MTKLHNNVNFQPLNPVHELFLTVFVEHPLDSPGSAKHSRISPCQRGTIGVDVCQSPGTWLAIIVVHLAPDSWHNTGC